VIGQLRALPSSVRLLLAGHLISALGTGLVLPFLVVYLHRVRGLPLSVATACVAAVAAGSVPANAVAGREIDRRGARPVLLAGLVVSVIGEVLLATTHEAWQALASTLLEGVGAGIEWPALAALLATAATGTHRPAAFGLKHALSNAGFAGGGVMAALAVRDLRPGPLVILYLLNAASFAVFAALLLMRPAHEMSGEPGDRVPGSYQQVLTDRRFRRLLGVIVLLVGCGYAQLHAAFPAYLAGPGGIGPSALAIAFTANTLAVVVLQLPVLRWGASWPRRWLVTGGALAFAACWLIVLVAGSTGGSPAFMLVVLAMVTMAGAEVLLSPSLEPLVNNYAPHDLRGRYNATQTLAWSAASVAGPVAAGPLLQVGAPVLFGLLIAGCAAAVLLAMGLREDAQIP
jgi:MFS family permease